MWGGNGWLAPRYMHDGTRHEITSLGGWIRDLTEEGIEPNPGLRYRFTNGSPRWLGPPLLGR
eukprot:4325001-Prymnesium_polylepis.1